MRIAPSPGPRGRPTPRRERRIFLSYITFWISAVGLGGSLIGFLTGTRFLLIPMVVFGVLAAAAFLVFTGTVASLALGDRAGRRPRRARR